MEVVKKTEQELLQDFLSNPENRQQAVEIAAQIKKVFPNWFIIPKLSKKFNVTTQEAAKKIELLVLFNLCATKVEKGILQIRIDLDQRTQREILNREIEEKEKELKFLKEKLAKLE